MPPEGFEYFYAYPNPGFLVFSAAQEKSKSIKGLLKTKKLVLFGQRYKILPFGFSVVLRVLPNV